MPQVLYEEAHFEGEKVTASEIITSKEYSIASMEAFSIYLQNHDKDIKKQIEKLDGYSYYMMHVADYLVGNTDRHWGNWGVLVDNANNKPVSLHKLMDFNQAFHAYDTLEGANCQTAFGAKMTQRQAAVEAVEKVGLKQEREVEKTWFEALPQYYEMFEKRLKLLRNAKNNSHAT